MSTLSKGWWQERIPANAPLVELALKEEIPEQLKSFFFALGGTPLLFFALQIVTGILLNFYYTPSAERAYDSVRLITYQVPFGWFIRGLHGISASVIIFMVLLHLVRVFFTKAYRRPRELNWILGVGLGLVTVAFGFTGYALVNDQLSYWATVVGTNLVGGIPLAGTWLLNLMRGGTQVTGNTLTRFYNFHIWVLPILTLILVGGHLLLVRLHGVAPLGEGKRETKTYPFFPDHIFLEILVGLAVLVILVNVVTLFPPALGAPADPLTTPRDIKPEWYFLFVYRWLKLVPLQVGVIGGAFFLLVLTAWPFIGEVLDQRWPKLDLPRIVGAIALILMIGFTLWELWA